MGNLSAEWVFAFGAVLSALIGAVASVLVQLMKRTNEMQSTIKIIHKITNQQKTDGERYRGLLERLLELNDIPVPVDQSKPILGHDDAEPGQPTKEAP